MMKNTLIKNLLSVFCAVALLTSCTKIIDLDLEEHTPKIVIEASVGTEPGDNMVLITRSKAFNSPDPTVPITTASVTIKDLTSGQTYILQEMDGIYADDSLQAQEEHTYELTVQVEGNTYTAKSTVPKNVTLTDFTQKGVLDDNNLGFSDLASVVPKYKDPADRENFYQFVIYRNDTLQQDILVRDDVVYNGLDVSSELFLEAYKNDTITIDFQSIDKPVYRYLFAFSKNVYQSSGTPANPVSNISNGALGYFKAHTSNFAEVIIK